MEYGFNPGLGIKKLHSMGYTGEGVNVAIVDQQLLLTHVEYQNRDIHYFKINEEELDKARISNTGSIAASILVGENTGVAPECTLYHVANPTWLRDQKNEADAFRKIIELNKSLPKDKKIRVISFAHSVDRNLTNWQMLQEAKKEAEAQGIIVVDAEFLRFACVTCLPWKDKDDIKNYKIAKNYDNKYMRNGSNVFFVPIGGKTIAYGQYDEHYFYQTNSGANSAIPYVAGVIALGLQVDPDMGRWTAKKYLWESGYEFYEGRLINPVGFIELVKKNCKKPHDVSKDKDYRYFLYNGEKVSAEDYTAIEDYVSRFDKKEECIIKDVSNYNSAVEILNFLKEDSKNKKGDLKGIQIFGSVRDVPSFVIHNKIKTGTEIDSGGFLPTDHFYSNFKSPDITDFISIYDIFTKNLDVSFIPEWAVARLPLGEGEYAQYFNEYYDHLDRNQNGEMPPADFSGPIFDPTRLDMDYGNPGYNYDVYMYSINSGNTVSDSFFKAKQAYALDVLQHKTTGGGSYQLELRNVLSQNYLGLLEFTPGAEISLRKLLIEIGLSENLYNNDLINRRNANENANENVNKNDNENGYGPANQNWFNIPAINKQQEEMAVFEDDHIQYGGISTPSKFFDSNFILKELSAAIDRENLYIKVIYISPIYASVGIRLAGDAPGLRRSWPDKTKPGENVVIFKLSKEEASTFSDSICIEVGDEHSITIEKNLVDWIISLPVSK